ncbi:hypothetical protein E2562_024962 [Oryza meyeriana var. granulata]|uniref:Uncharacterized protein n=1 Tax=Oryza meyeriana var. granulata TaxID=110450 RepID=A0A6G1DN18_9ORYZ|nr:hypothetical protein E2562_024962 [Oryza meyeriana var. granulata]
MGRMSRASAGEWVAAAKELYEAAEVADGLPVMPRSVDGKRRTGGIFVLERACVEVGKFGKVWEASPGKNHMLWERLFKLLTENSEIAIRFVDLMFGLCGEVVAADEALAANGEVPTADDGEAVATDEAPAPNAQAFSDNSGSVAAAGGSRSPCLTVVGRMLKAVVTASLVAFFYSVVTASTTI